MTKPYGVRYCGGEDQWAVRWRDAAGAHWLSGLTGTEALEVFRLVSDPRSTVLEWLIWALLTKRSSRIAGAD